MVQAAMIAAIYIVLTLMLIPLGYGPVQFRVSEALCILPYFTPAAIPGVFIGCLLSNALGGAVILDVIFGSLASLIGAVGSYLLRRWRWAVCIPPIVSNTLIIPWILRFAYGNDQIIRYMMVTVGIGEVLAIGVLGNLLMLSLERYRNVLFK